ncbi:MAG: hypothetical protein ACUVQ1_01810 [Candidatus Kapaibacteriales bacterium]
MNYEYLIEKYFEGGLDPTEKEILFSELARNPHLREEFENEMKLINLAQRDFSQIQPPVESMNYVFASLGFKIPNVAGNSAGASKIPFFAKFQEFLANAIPYLAVSFLASGITLFLFWLFFYPSTANVRIVSEVPKINSTSETTTSTNTDQKNTTQKFNPQVTDIAVLERFFKRTIEEILKMQGYQNHIGNLASNSTLTSKFYTSEINPTALINNNKTSDSRIIVSSPKEFINNIADFNIPAFSSIQVTSTKFSQYLKNLNVSIRGFSLKSEPNTKVNYEQTGLLKDVGIGIGYDFSRYSTFGIEFGQEKFPQNFELNLYGELTYYRQNPILWWYGIYYHQKIPFLFQNETLNPYLHAFLGGTSVGPLLKGSIGLEFAPDRRVSLLLGWENSLLFYNVQNKIYKTKKNGLTYGVNVRF